MAVKPLHIDIIFANLTIVYYNNGAKQKFSAQGSGTKMV